MESCLLENNVKFRDGKRWKSRLCILKKLSPVADCLHLLVYKESSGKKCNKEKASILLEKYCGVETGYQVDKEQNVLAILCVKQVVLLAFQRKNTLIDWLVILREQLGHEKVFHATIIKSPPHAKLQQGPVRLFIVNKRISLISQIPPIVLLSWFLSDLRKFGAVDSDKFCLEGGTRAGTGNGLFAFLTDYGGEIERLLERLCSSALSLSRRKTHTGCLSSSSSQSSIATVSPKTPTSPVFVFPPVSHHQQFSPQTSRFSAFSDIGAFSSEVQRCLSQNSLQDKAVVCINDSEDCQESKQLHSQRNVEYVNVSTASCENSLNKASSQASHNNLPIAHGHSKSLGCEPEIYMDLSNILKRKCKNDGTSSSSSQDVFAASTIVKPLAKVSSITKSTDINHSSTGEVRSNNEIKNYGGTDLLTEILRECKMDLGSFKKEDRGLSEKSKECSISDVRQNTKSQVNSSGSTVKTQNEEIHNYCNFPLPCPETNIKDTCIYQNLDTRQRRDEATSPKFVCSVKVTHNTENLHSHNTLSFSEPNVNDIVKLGESESARGNTHKSYKMERTKKNSKKSNTNRHSRSLPDFDPLRPLEFVDLSKFDGKDEGYLYWVKAGPNPEVTPITSQGYDNIPNRSPASYANVNMQKKCNVRQGYDNLPTHHDDAKKHTVKQYDNLCYMDKADNRPDCVKAMKYENLPCRDSRQNTNSHAVYENWSKSTTGDNKVKSDFMANVPPAIPEKGLKHVSKKSTSSRLPYGGAFAIHGSLRRPKPLHREHPMSNHVVSQAGDIAGSYVMLKDAQERQHCTTNVNLGVSNLAANTNLLIDRSNGEMHGPNSDVELVILEMSDDDPQRDNIANMLVEHRQKPHQPMYGRTGPPRPLPPRRFSFHADTYGSTVPGASGKNSTQVNKTHLGPSHNSAFTPLDKKSFATHSNYLGQNCHMEANHYDDNDTYTSSSEVTIQECQRPVRKNEYIDMSQPFRPPKERSVSPDCRVNSSTKFTKEHHNNVGDSPYMDMSFMKNAIYQDKLKSNGCTIDTQEQTYSNVPSITQNNNSLNTTRRLHHSKSLDNELDEVYIDTDILLAAKRSYTDNENLPLTSAGDQQYIPMSTINRHIDRLQNPDSNVSVSTESHLELSDEDNKPAKPFEGLLDFPPYTEKKMTLSLSPKKSLLDCKESGMDRHKLNVDEDNVSIGSSSSGSTTTRRSSKGLFARLMRRNSSAKDLGKLSSKSEEDILEANNFESEQHRGLKEPIYAQIPEKGYLHESATLPLKKTSHSSADSLLLDTDIQNERIKLLSGKVCLEHGNLTDEQKQSCTSLLSERSMTPPTPPPNIPLPPPPLPPPRVTKASTVDTPPVPPKTYKNILKQLPYQRKPEPEYVDIDDDDFPCGTGRETFRNGTAVSSSSTDPPQIMDGLVYAKDGRPVPPPRPPSCVINQDNMFEEDMQLFHGSFEKKQFQGKKSQPFVQRSISLRTQRERIYPNTHRYLIDSARQGDIANVNSSPSSLTTISRPRSGKQYSTVDRRRWLEHEEYFSSGASSGSRTPASPQYSPTKSPGSVQSSVFNFDSAAIKMSKHHHHHSGSETDSPKSPGITKPGFRDPDHVYMNLTFPKTSRSASPIVIDSSRHKTISNMADYANVVLNYAEIDLSRSSEKSKKSERVLQKSNIDYAMIDMVATAAASRAGKEHARNREDSLKQTEITKNYRRSESADTKEKTPKRSKDRGKNEASASPSLSGKEKRLGRSNSAVSRGSSTSSVDRKQSLPV